MTKAMDGWHASAFASTILGVFFIGQRIQPSANGVFDLFGLRANLFGLL